MMTHLHVGLFYLWDMLTDPGPSTDVSEYGAASAIARDRLEQDWRPALTEKTLANVKRLMKVTRSVRDLQGEGR